MIGGIDIALDDMIAITIITGFFVMCIVVSLLTDYKGQVDRLREDVDKILHKLNEESTDDTDLPQGGDGGGEKVPSRSGRGSKRSRSSSKGH